jgi:hypothetical protein
VKWQVSLARDLLIGAIILGLPFLMELILVWWLIDPSTNFPNCLYNIFEGQISHRPLFAIILLIFSFIAILLAFQLSITGQDSSQEGKVSLKELKEVLSISLTMQLCLVGIWGLLLYFDNLSWDMALAGTVIILYPFFTIILIPLCIGVIVILAIAALQSLFKKLL